MSRPITNLAALLASGPVVWLLGLAFQATPAVYRIGLWRAFCLLQDLVFFFRHPRLYHQIRAALGDRSLDRQRMVRLAVIIHAHLSNQGIRARIHGRCKRIVSIHRKMALKELALDQIHDLRALRIIVPDVPTCYETLAVLQRLFPTLPDLTDDYIAHPKRNGYRSLHATILDGNGYSCEVQIRTPSMHRIAESGAAAHWRYKADCLRSPAHSVRIDQRPSPTGQPKLQTDN
jgi:GTP pyrophosphokinase